MNKRSLFILGAAALSGAVAIAVIVKKRVLHGSGNIITQERTVEPFSTVSLGGLPGLVYVEQADESTIKVLADDNLVDFVETTVDQGTLTIKLVSGGMLVMPKQKIEVHVAGPHIDHLRLDAKGSLRVKAIQADSFRIDINGVGDVKGGPITAQKLMAEINGIGNCELSGRAEEQAVTVNGIGKYQAAALSTHKTRVEVNGVGDVEVRVDEELTVELSGKCKVKYHGNPKVTSNIARPGVVVQALEPQPEEIVLPQAEAPGEPVM